MNTGEEYSSKQVVLESTVITGGTYNVSNFYNSEYSHSGATLSNATVKGTIWNENDAVIDMVTADYVISTAYEGENGLVPGTITWYNDTPSERSERDESLVFCIKRKQLWLSQITQLEETIDSITVDSEDDNNVWGWELEEPMVQTYSLSAL